jgi:hypothetical protein
MRLQNTHLATSSVEMCPPVCFCFFFVFFSFCVPLSSWFFWQSPAHLGSIELGTIMPESPVPAGFVLELNTFVNV